MKKGILVVLGAIALVGMFFSNDASAQTCNNNSRNVNRGYVYQQYNPYNGYYRSNNSINYQQYNQQRRINQGVRSGQLTPEEAYRLKQQEALLRRQEALAKRDGYVSYQERVELNRQLNQLGREIHQEKHDSQSTCNSRNSRNYTTRNYWRR